MKILKNVLMLSVLFIAIQVNAQKEEKMKKKFGRVDTDNNKEVSMEEMIAFHEGKTTKKGESFDVEGMFLGLDSNDDGKLVLSEFIKPIDWKKAKQKSKELKKIKKVQKVVKKAPSSQVEKKFRWMDTDRNDYITKAEWVKFQEDKAKKMGEPAKNVDLKFLGTDKNNDGKITMEELAQDVDWKLAKQRKKAQ